MKYNDAQELLASLKAGQVYLFHWKIETEQPHYQVILNKDFFESWSLIYISVSTTKIEKKERYITINNFPKETLVITEIWDVDFLPKRSCFNCNEIVSYEVFQLYWEYLSNNFIYKWELPKHILEKIYEWIKISPHVPNYIKRKIWII